MPNIKALGLVVQDKKIFSYFPYISLYVKREPRPNFLSLLLTGKIHRGVTERVGLKRNSQAVNIMLFNVCV